MARQNRRARPNDKPALPPRVAVKFKEEAAAPGPKFRGLRAYLQREGIADGTLALLPLIESVKPGPLAELVAKARRLDPEYVPANFAKWFQVVTPAELNVDNLAKALREHPDVETAYVMKPGPPPVVDPTDDPRSTNQGYLDAAPNGIDARFAWGFIGGDGDGIGFVDMEQGWNLNHEDLAAAGITLISGINNAYFYHGTSVLGEVLMVDNAIGGVGIAPACTGRVISQQRSAAIYNTPDAIVDAIAHMAFGDVLLLEAQEFDPVSGDYLWPVEIVDGTYDAIRLATALGIVVIEAGCNGSYDLDPYANLAGKKIFDRTSADFRDSGAIMVGAGSSASPHTRLDFSNYGNRIDCYAWGENIDTTSTDAAGTDNTLYTTSFDGTSGASPIVAGAALIVQGLVRAAFGYRFSPRAMRQILTTGGTPSDDPPNDRIGVMPDLRAIINNNQINLAPDVYLRDYVGDDGHPTAGAVSMSPDIIVRQAAVADPTAAYGAGSGTENDAALSQPVETGHDHFVYVRVLNHGGSAAAAVDVDVYWSPPATLVTPNLWNKIGTATLANVLTGNVLTVAGGLTWNQAALPAPGHYCFIAVAGNALDPKPDPTAFTTWDNYLTYVRNNNNVAWRNFDVVPPPPSAAPQKRKFIVPGAFDTSRTFALESIGALPQGSRVFLEVPAWLADALRPHPYEVKPDGKRGFSVIPLPPSGRQHLGSAVLHAKSLAECVLHVQLPKDARAPSYDFAIRQLYKEQEVGRLTWRFSAVAKERRENPPRRKRSARRP